MSKSLKIVATVVIVILVFGLVAWGAWRWFSRQALPKVSGTTRLAGLQQSSRDRP